MKLFKLKKKNLFFTVILLFLILGGLSLYQNFKSKPLNLVLISIDTLRPDHMGVYGYPKDTTPNIDKWAKNAKVFTNVHTVVPMTNPSFSALLTGKHPFDSKITSNRGWSVSENSQTLISILKANGYKTAAFTTGSINPTATNLHQGAEVSEYMGFKKFFFSENIESYYQTDRDDYENFIKKAEDWIGDKEKFFLWVHLMDPHAPYFPPEDLKCKFNSKYCDYITKKDEKELEEERALFQFCKPSPIPEQKVELFETLYDGGVAYSDQLVGKILDLLEQKGLSENTMVVLYGDHGEGFDHNYYFNHRHVLYESATRIPLIIKYPKGFPSGRSDLLIDNTDILPTLLDLLSLKIENGIQLGQKFSSQLVFNVSNLPIFNQAKQAIYLMSNNLTKYAIIEDGYKYIYSTDNSCLLNNQTEELYNLKKDPKEETNLVKTEESKTKKIKAKLLNQLSKYNLPPKVQGVQNLQNPLRELSY